MLSAAWTSGVLFDPAVQIGSLAAIGAFITRIVLRHHTRSRLIGQVVLFAALTFLLIGHGIIPWATAASDISLFRLVFIGLAKIVWWTNAAWALVAFVRVFLILERPSRESRLLQDLTVGLIHLGVVLCIATSVFAIPIGTLVATSGVFAIILGLAMQSTLSDVFSGLALNLGRSYSVGDWIVLDNGIEGRVVETNWRATHLLTGTNDLVIFPNSALAKVSLTNLSFPDRAHGLKLTVRFVPDVPPALVVEVMRTALLSATSALPTPAPTAHVKSMDGTAVEVELSLRVSDVSGTAVARSEVLDLVYRHAKSAGLVLAPAPTAPMTASPAIPTRPHRTTPYLLLDVIPLFSSLTEDEKEALAATMVRRTYPKGAVLVEQDEASSALMIIRTGVVAVSREGPIETVELYRLAPGDWFGEGGLLAGLREAGTARALTFAVVYEIAQAGLSDLLQDRPGLAEEFAEKLSHTSKTHAGNFHQEDDAAGQDARTPLLARIREVFKLETE